MSNGYRDWTNGRFMQAPARLPDKLALSERLRFANPYADPEGSGVPALLMEAANTVDVLVSALKAARGSINDTPGYQDIAEIIDAALALAHNGGK